MKKESKKSRILEFMKLGNGITKAGALKKFRHGNLGDCIFQLRNSGHNIVTEMRRNSRVDNPGEHAVYFMEEFSGKLKSVV